MTVSIVLQFVVVLAAIWMGARFSGVGLGLWGAVGLLVLVAVSSPLLARIPQAAIAGLLEAAEVDHAVVDHDRAGVAAADALDDAVLEEAQQLDLQRVRHGGDLVADESGMWVLSKRLDRGTFAWPAADAAVVRIEYREEQLALLLRGFDVEGLRPRPWRRRVLQHA